MTSLTRRSIMDSFIKLLDERPLNKISVKDIVEECGINRNTFYYHFADIPALVEEIIKSEADRIMQLSAGVTSLEECVEAAMQLSKAHRRAIWHIYNSANRAMYEQYLLEICRYVVTAFIENAAKEWPMSEADKAAIIQGYKCECFGFITDWLNSGMSDDLEAQFLRLCELRRGMAEEQFRRACER